MESSGREAPAAGSPEWLLRWTGRSAGVLARAGLLVLLAVLTYQQLLEFHSEPVTSEVVPAQALFPRLTVCPATGLADAPLLDRYRRLVDGSISVLGFYNQTTLEIFGGNNQFSVGDGVDIIQKVLWKDSSIGAWRTKFYLHFDPVDNFFLPMRCLTFLPSGELHARGGTQIEAELRLSAAPLFMGTKKITYRLFVHGLEEPNVGDLVSSEQGQPVPLTLHSELRPGRRNHFRVTARLKKLANVGRRPCRSEPGYSPAQCLKECLWRRLAEHTGCRLPHMVSADVYLPEMRGPLDHLPLCSRLVQANDTFRKLYALPPTSDTCLSDSAKWSRPTLSQQAGRSAGEARDDAVRPGSRVPRAPPPAPPPLPEPPPADANLQVSRALLSDVRGCSCPAACRQTRYELHLSTGAAAEEDSVLSSCASAVWLQLDLQAEQLQETPAFSTGTLLANLGGIVGLVAGFSIFTVVELAEAAAAAAESRWRAYQDERREEEEEEKRTQRRSGWLAKLRLPWK